LETTSPDAQRPPSAGHAQLEAFYVPGVEALQCVHAGYHVRERNGTRTGCAEIWVLFSASGLLSGVRPVANGGHSSAYALWMGYCRPLPERLHRSLRRGTIKICIIVDIDGSITQNFFGSGDTGRA
jgi:hypothetical protein